MYIIYVCISKYTLILMETSLLIAGTVFGWLLSQTMHLVQKKCNSFTVILIGVKLQKIKIFKLIELVISD